MVFGLAYCGGPGPPTLGCEMAYVTFLEEPAHKAWVIHDVSLAHAVPLPWGFTIKLANVCVTNITNLCVCQGTTVHAMVSPRASATKLPHQIPLCSVLGILAMPSVFVVVWGSLLPYPHTMGDLHDLAILQLHHILEIVPEIKIWPWSKCMPRPAEIRQLLEEPPLIAILPQRKLATWVTSDPNRCAHECFAGIQSILCHPFDGCEIILAMLGTPCGQLPHELGGWVCGAPKANNCLDAHPTHE